MKVSRSLRNVGYLIIKVISIVFMNFKEAWVILLDKAFCNKWPFSVALPWLSQAALPEVDVLSVA